MIIEIEPVGLNDMNILWEWHYWDHLVQNLNMNLDNYGQISENPQLLDINVSQSGNGGGNGNSVFIPSINISNSETSIMKNPFLLIGQLTFQ